MVFATLYLFAGQFANSLTSRSHLHLQIGEDELLLARRIPRDGFQLHWQLLRQVAQLTDAWKAIVR